MPIKFRHLGLAALLSSLLSSPVLALTLGQVERQGMQMSVVAQVLNASEDAPLRTGKQVRISLALHDTTTGQPFNGAYPAAWIHPLDEHGAECRDKVQSFLSGSLFSQALLELNSYQVLTLNADPSISVIDPQFGFGNGRLLRTIDLPSRGFDWVRTADYRTLFVSLPIARQVQRLDTADWARQVNHVPRQYGAPRHLALQPDERYLWVALRESVAVLDSHNLKPIALIPTGRQPVAIQFTPDSQFAFVANYVTNNISVIDIAGLRKLKDIPTGQQPASIDYSTLAEALYVAHQGDGQITVIDGYDHEIVAQTSAEPGISMLRFTPDQRWALLVNPRTDRLSILDAATNRIVNTGLVEKTPEQIAFSSELAYIRHRHSNQLLMLTLKDANIGQPGKAIPVVDAPGGDKPPGRMSFPTPALGIQQVPGANAVVISNPGDRALYFYKEGMAAPMGQFFTGKQAARAVLTLDRSLKERRQPGWYETIIELPSAGQYELIVYLDSPRFIHCLPLTIHDLIKIP